MRLQANNISKTIQDFNKQCAEERKRRTSVIPNRAQKRIQNYGIDMSSLLGQGTFSKVFRGREVNREAIVAVKVVELRKIEELGIEDLFWQEINIVRKLKHPNVLSCLEYFKTNNNCYTVYEFCEGGDLASRLKKGHLGDKEDLGQANYIIRDVFQGLLYLQSISIVHRDIKAANILLTGGKAKIGDFGFATYCKHQFTDVSIGSPAYMAPEGLLNNIYGPKTDVWSFGMLIFQILHGRTPFYNCESQGELKQRVQVPINWDQLKGSLPSPLKRLILKCLKVDYALRPTFTELMNDEYMLKILKQGGGNRQICKSNDTKLTSDSQATNPSSAINKNGRNERKSISPTCYKQRLLTEDGQECKVSYKVKTESNEDEADSNFACMLAQSLNIQELIELANKQQKRAQIHLSNELIKPQQQQPELKGILKRLRQTTIERFVLLTHQSYSEETLKQFLKALKTFQQTLTLVKASLEHQYFTEFFSQFLLQIYHIAIRSQHFSIIQQIQNSADLALSFNNERNDITESLKVPFQQIQQQIFMLIKQTETQIDQQDIQGKSGQQLKELAYKGCLLIVSIRLVYAIQRGGDVGQWVNNQSNLHSCQQFFIWLYELQLFRMQLEQQH